MSVNNRGKKILLVDDDQALRTVLAEQLDLYDGFTTIQVGTAAEGLERAKLAHYDAILLDIGLPDMDGRELCKLMRRQGVRSPVIMLTAADSDADTILGLESGANDYVTKPFRINVLLARLRAHLREHARSAFTLCPSNSRSGSSMVRPNSSSIGNTTTARRRCSSSTRRASSSSGMPARGSTGRSSSIPTIRWTSRTRRSRSGAPTTGTR